MQLRPVVTDPDLVVGVVSDRVGRSLRAVAELDVDVYRLGDAYGPDLVVRAFGPDVPATSVDAVVTVLDGLAGTRFPAERCAGPAPVIELDGGVRLLVTEYVAPTPAPRPGFLLAWCGGLLGVLAGRDSSGLPAGGGWHRLGPTPGDEVDAALRLLADVAGAGALEDALAEADDADGLPEALVHADLTPPNLVPRGAESPVVIDWIGVGRGARLWPLAFLLQAAGPRGAPVVLKRYAGRVTLTDEEWTRLPGLMATRPLTLDAWSVAFERMTPERALRRHHDRAAGIDRTVAAMR